MSWREKIAEWIAPRAVKAAGSYPLPAIVKGSQSWEDLFGPHSEAPMPTAENVLTLSAVYACVNLYAGAISSLVKHLYRVDIQTGEKDRLPSDRLWWVLNEEFTPRWSAAAGWEFIIQALLLKGDGFATILRDRAAMPVGLRPAHPDDVEVLVNTAEDRLVYAITEDVPDNSGRRRRVIYDQDDVIHIAGMGFDGTRGLSPLRYALRHSAAVALAAQDFSASFFANQARPDYALQTEQKLSQEAIDSLREQVSERHGGAGRAFKPMVLQGGLDIKTITMPIEDTQLIEMRKFQVEDIARAYGVPPFMIGSTEKTTSWGSGVEAMGTGFVRFSLRQHLNKIEAELNRKLFRTAAKRMEFDTFDLERADMRTMFEAFRVALGRAGEPGFMTAEEVRQRLSMKRAPDAGTLNPGASNAPPSGQPAQA